MFCSGCGNEVPQGSAFCPQCGRPSVAAPAAAIAPASSVPPAPIAAPRLVFAGFWLRFVAYLIDGLIIGFAEIILILTLIAALGLGPIRNLPEDPDVGAFFTASVVLGIIVFVIIVVAILWLYFACMESSRQQGTLGKMALGLVVTDLQARPVSFGRASGRFFAKFITGLIPLCIGYIMAGFTEKKQALHDMIASCLVLRKI